MRKECTNYTRAGAASQILAAARGGEKRMQKLQEQQQQLQIPHPHRHLVNEYSVKEEKCDNKTKDVIFLGGFRWGGGGIKSRCVVTKTIYARASRFRLSRETNLELKQTS